MDAKNVMVDRGAFKARQETLATAVYEQLRQDILTVALPAESKLKNKPSILGGKI